MNRLASYESIVWTAVVAGVFSAIVCCVLVGRLLFEPALLALDEPQYEALRQQLATSGDDPSVQDQLRTVDIQLREEYFRQQAFTRRGGYLLVGGLAATLLLWQWAVLIRPRPPQLQPEALDDHQLRENHRAQWASGVVAIALVSSIVVWKISYPSVLRGGLDTGDKGALTAADSPREQADRPDTPVVAEVPPTAEEWARNWHRFRGPQGAGVSAFTNVPQTWTAAGDGVKWKTAVPLPGLSSPIVWENRIFLTGANRKERVVYCFDTETGELLWQGAVESTSPEAGKLRVDDSTGYAAPTPATDGRRVYAIFATGDVAAFTFDGKPVWSRGFGVPENPYGHAASLAMSNDLVIVQMDQGHGEETKSKLLALHGRTGETAWEVKRESPATWSSPIVVEFENQPRVITCSDPWVIAYNASNGDEIWRAECLSGEIGPSPVYKEGVVFVAGDNAAVAAIRDGGKGNVTDSHILWTAEFGLPDICSPLVTEKHVLLIASYGDFVCYDRKTGGEEPLLEESLDDVMMASPSLVGDLVYLIGERGKGWVVRVGEEGLERIAENDLGESCFATPSFQSGRIYIRGKQHLFCIAEE